jgi:hypothetical protein
MKHKNFLLVAFFLTLFVFQQVQAGATIPSNKTSLINVAPANTVLFDTVYVYMYPLVPLTGELASSTKCQWPNNDYGCGSTPPPIMDQSPTGSFFRVNVEDDSSKGTYLRDVIATEMNLAELHPPEPEALMAQTVAARTFASWKSANGPWDNGQGQNSGVCPYINNSRTYQVYIPGAHVDSGYPSEITKAVDDTKGQFLQYVFPNGTKHAIDASFAADMLGAVTQDGGDPINAPYKVGVQDPISIGCVKNLGNAQYGMSQRGAIRWAKGNTCPEGTGTDWRIKWNYQQILAHYYTGVQFIDDDTGTLFAPDDRWNLLWHNNFNNAALTGGQRTSLQIRLQNTSTTAWSANDVIEINYHWGDGNWQIASVNPVFTELPAGKEFPDINAPPLTVSDIIAPSVLQTETRTLHLDMKRNGVRLSSGDWPDAQIKGITVTGGSTPTPTSTINSGTTPTTTPTVNGMPTSTPTPTINSGPTPTPTAIAKGILPSRNGNGPAYVTVPVPVVMGKRYRVTIFGFANLNATTQTDAQWNTYRQTPGCFCEYYRRVIFNGVGLAAQNGQSARDPDHTYLFLWTANSSQLQMYFWDNYYADNSGSLTYEITEDTFSNTLTPTPTNNNVTSTSIAPGFTQSAPTATFTPAPPTSQPPTAEPFKPTCRYKNNNSLTNRNIGVKLSSLSQAFVFAANNFDRIEDQADLLYCVRDELLNTSAEGRRYIDVYYAHSAEIAEIMLAYPKLDEQGLNVIDAFTPNLQSLLDGQGNSAVITAEQTQQAQAFLDALLPYASSALRQTIMDERARRPLETTVGMTMSEAWDYLNGYQLTWFPPLNTKKPYAAQQGRVIPVEFTLTDQNGNFVEDRSVTLRVLDANGLVVFSSVGISENPKQGISVQAEKYHYNLDTSSLQKGDYALHILYNSLTPQTPSSWQVTVTSKK